MLKNSDISKRIFYYLWFIVVASMFMMFLMYAVYCIPVAKIRNNVEKSIDVLIKISSIDEHGTMVLMESVPLKGSFWHKMAKIHINMHTDPRMLNEAQFIGLSENDYLLNPRIHYGYEPMYSLYRSVYNTGWEIMNIKNLSVFIYQSEKERPKEGVWIDLYPRFWHGYLIFLKPLLLIFDLQGIRYVNLLFQAGMLLAILYLIYKRLGFRHCVAFITAMWFLNPFTSWLGLENTMDTNVMLLAVLWVLLNRNINDNWMFFIIGAVTIMFDFLTFPLITLGIPLILYISLYERGFREDVKCVIKNSLLWLFGYAGMTFSKWGVVTLLTDYNVIKDGWANVLHRVNGATERGDAVLDVTPFHAISGNVDYILSGSAFMVLGISLFLLLMSCFYKPCRFKGNLKALVLLGISLMPFVWYSVLAQHSIIHVLFVYRLLVITIYALLVAIICCLEVKIKTEEMAK